MREQRLSDSITLGKEAPLLFYLSFHVLTVVHTTVDTIYIMLSK